MAVGSLGEAIHSVEGASLPLGADDDYTGGCCGQLGRRSQLGRCRFLACVVGEGVEALSVRFYAAQRLASWLRRRPLMNLLTSDAYPVSSIRGVS